MFRVPAIVLFALLVWAAPTAVRTAPAIDLPQIVYADGVLGDAQLGAALSKALELSENLDDLRAPAAQTFLDQTFAQLTRTRPELPRPSIDAEREALRTAAGSTAETIRRLTAFTSTIVATMPKDQKEAFIVGVLATQIAYNAAVLRDPTSGKQFRTVLSTLAAIDATFPIVADLRRSLVAIDETDWERASIGSRAVESIVLQAGTKRAETPPTVAVLLAGRRLTDAGPRKGTMHTFIEFVAQDGSRRTLAGYSSGDWSAPSGALHCQLDKEPAGAADFAFPLRGPLGNAAPTQFMILLVGRCAAFEANVAARPVPYSATGYTDNSVLSGLLEAVSPNDVADASRVMRL